MKKIPAIFISAAILLCGCGKNNAHSKDIFAMDTYMSLKAYGKNAEKALSASEEEIFRLENIFSVTKDSSEIRQINRSGGEPVKVSLQTFEIISLAKEYGEKTGGALDITVYPLLREWGFTTGENKIPDKETIEKLLESVDLCRISTENGAVSVPSGTEIDLGAIAKGYAGDKVTEIMRGCGVDSAIISLGGNVQTIGTKPDGSMWRVGIASPFSAGEEIGAVSVADKAVVTSGNYERYFIGSNGKRYCHIIDPKSGYPVDNGLASVTVIGESGAVCDALSTALFVMGYEKAAEFYRENGGFEIIMIFSDKSVKLTAGIEKNTVFADGIAAEVIN